MIDSDKKLFGFPIHFTEQGESLFGDKNLPAVKVDHAKAEEIGDKLSEAIENAGRALDRENPPRDGNHNP